MTGRVDECEALTLREGGAVQACEEEVGEETFVEVDVEERTLREECWPAILDGLVVGGQVPGVGGYDGSVELFEELDGRITDVVSLGDGVHGCGRPWELGGVLVVWLRRNGVGKVGGGLM